MRMPRRLPMRGRALARMSLVAVLLAASLIAGCARPVLPPAIVTAPRYPEFIFPALTPPDPKQAELVKLHDAAWRWMQTGDLARAEREFQVVLKRSPAFYPSEAAMGYVELARESYPAALDRFDRVLSEHPTYVSAIVGRGEALLAQAREAEALAAFETALKYDPALSEVGRRVEVLRARAAQENVAAARRAAQEGRLDDAARAYELAIVSSPDSAFLYRDLAEVEARQGKTALSLGHFRKAIELDPSDVPARVRIAEMLDVQGDIEGAIAMYNEAHALEPSAEIRRRLAALEARAAYLRLPAEYRAIPDAPAITRGDLAALIGIGLQPLLATVAAQPVVITDTRTHWASDWINASAGAGVMDPYENHTFQPRNGIRRSDLAQAVSRLLKIIALRQPALLKDWQSRQQKMADVGVSNLNFADVSLSVAAGILPLAEGGQFQLSRAVSGAEAIDAVTRLDRLFNASR
jgi:tetratricopeptide (TPR) repeat protein